MAASPPWNGDNLVKNPYFTMPDARYLHPTTDRSSSTRQTPTHRPNKAHSTIQELFGIVVKMSQDDQARFLLTLMKHGRFEPDFQAAAEEWNVAGGYTVQRRFKTIVEKNNFSLDAGNQVTGGPDTSIGEKPTVDDALPQTPAQKHQKRLKKPAEGGEGPVKKRKIAKTDSTEDNGSMMDGSGQAQTMATKATSTVKGKRKEASQNGPKNGEYAKTGRRVADKETD